MELENKCKNCSYLDNLWDILNCSRDVLYKYNFKTHRYDFISNSIECLTGLTPEQITSKGVESIRELLHPDDLEMFEDVYKKLLNSKITDDQIVLEYRTKNLLNGKYLWRSDHINIIRDDHGMVDYIVGNARDVSKSKASEKKIQDLMENYKKLYDNAEVALFRTNVEDSRLLECNEMFYKMLGYDSKEQCLENFNPAKMCVKPSFREKLRARLLENGFINQEEIEVYRKDGSVCVLSLTIRYQPNTDYYDGSAVEITDLKKLTHMEITVLKMIVDGYSNRDIAEQLERSVRTIEDHRTHIMKKMGTKNLVQLTKKAIEAGI